MRHLPRSIALTGAAAVVAVPVAAATPAHRDHARHRHAHVAAVFVQTDATTGNAIISYRRHTDGSLTRAGTYATGGNGGIAAGAVADPLASQGSLVTADGGRELLAVNAGSDTVSVFDVHGTALRLRQTIGSGGAFPTSIAVHGRRVEVLNAGGVGTVAGFRLDDGRLRPVSGGTRSLGLANGPVPNVLTSPGQVGFTPDGAQVIVTTKASSSSFEVFGVGRDGRLSSTATVTPSATPVPFAFAFGPRGELVVGEAAQSTVSTYTLTPDGATHLIGSEADAQAALCWIVEARGVYYVSNAASANVSAYRVTPSGAPQLIGIAAPAHAGTTDSIAAGGGRFIYVESGGAGTVDGFAVDPDGTLTHVVAISGLPIGIEGIASVG